MKTLAPPPLRSLTHGLVMILTLVPAGLLVPVAHADDVMQGWARRGAVYQRTEMDEGTARACAALCDLDGQCQAWVWSRPGLQGPDAMCALLSTAHTPYRAPGQVTGLGAELRTTIVEATERPPSQREIEALRALASPLSD